MRTAEDTAHLGAHAQELPHIVSNSGATARGQLLASCCRSRPLSSSQLLIKETPVDSLPLRMCSGIVFQASGHTRGRAARRDVHMSDSQRLPVCRTCADAMRAAGAADDLHLVQPCSTVSICAVMPSNYFPSLIQPEHHARILLVSIPSS